MDVYERQKVTPAPVRPDETETEIALPKQRKIVAVVDDDPSMLRATKNLLGASGFATKAFASAEEFLK